MCKGTIFLYWNGNKNTIQIFHFAPAHVHRTASATIREWCRALSLLFVARQALSVPQSPLYLHRLIPSFSRSFFLYIFSLNIW
mgnify:CR=1 FL=1